MCLWTYFVQELPAYDDKTATMGDVMMKALRSVLFLVLAAALTALPLMAQTGTASLKGEVTDQKDAVVVVRRQTVGPPANFVILRPAAFRRSPPFCRTEGSLCPLLHTLPLPAAILAMSGGRCFFQPQAFNL